MTNSEKFLKRILKIRPHHLPPEKLVCGSRSNSVFKSRDITLLTKIQIVKTMAFLVVTYSSENWTINKAECQRIDAFKMWCWRRVLKVTWTARSNLSILREIHWIFTEYSLKGLMVKLKLQYFWSSDVHRQLIGKVPDAGKDQGQKEKRVSEDEMAGQHHRCN